VVRKSQIEVLDDACIFVPYLNRRSITLAFSCGARSAFKLKE
jgi:hypothetical protein